MNILLEGGLPEEIDGVPIFADYRNMIRFSGILADPSLSEGEKIACGLQQLFDELPPGGVQHAFERLMWFFNRDIPEQQGEGGKKPARPRERSYDLNVDGGMIYAAFLQTYGINLVTVKFLHWWEFMALLEALPDNTLMAQVMRYRTMDLNGIKDKQTRAHYADMKKRFALDAPARRTRSVEEITRQNKERLTRRFEEAERQRQAALAQPQAQAAQDESEITC